MPYFEGTVTLSGHLDYFEHQGACYVYHNLFGYILQMSEDIIALMEFFRGVFRSAEEVDTTYNAQFSRELLDNFMKVLLHQGCLVPWGQSEEAVALTMVPVQARWIVYHQPPRGPVVLFRARRDRDGVEEIALDPWDGALWRLVDGERTMLELAAAIQSHPDSPSMGVEQKVLATVSKLTHSEAQFLKLSPKPMSAYRAEASKRAIPPYLISTMPYRRITDEIRGEHAIRVGLDAQEAPISRADLERDRVGATLGHLLRKPHEALGGRTFGGALCDRARAQGALSSGGRVLEVGAVTASNIVGLLDRLRETAPEVYAGTRCALVTPDPVFIDDMAEALAASGHQGVEIMVGEPDSLDAIEGLQGPFDFIFSDEYIARLDATLMCKIPPDEDEDEEAEEVADDGAAKNGQTARRRDLFLGEGDGVNLIFTHGLTFHDVEGEFFLNAGAIRFLEQAAARLAPGGILTVIEFGDLFAYPKPVGEGDQVQFPIHFRILQQVGRSLGLEAEFDWLLNAMGLDTNLEMLATTRHSFRALRRLLEKAGVALEDVAYSRSMFEALLAGSVEIDEVRRLEFEALNDRAMGIVPSSIKVMDLRRPLVAAGE